MNVAVFSTTNFVEQRIIFKHFFATLVLNSVHAVVYNNIFSTIYIDNNSFKHFAVNSGEYSA